MKNALYWAGVLAAAGAVVMGLIGSNVNAAGLPQDAHPLGAVGIAIAALAFFKGYEVTKE